MEVRGAVARQDLQQEDLGDQTGDVRRGVLAVFRPQGFDHVHPVSGRQPAQLLERELADRAGTDGGLQAKPRDRRLVEAPPELLGTGEHRSGRLLGADPDGLDEPGVVQHRPGRVLVAAVAVLDEVARRRRVVVLLVAVGGHRPDLLQEEVGDRFAGNAGLERRVDPAVVAGAVLQVGLADEGEALALGDEPENVRAQEQQLRAVGRLEVRPEEGQGVGDAPLEQPRVLADPGGADRLVDVVAVVVVGPDGLADLVGGQDALRGRRGQGLEQLDAVVMGDVRRVHGSLLVKDRAAERIGGVTGKSSTNKAECQAAWAKENGVV